MICPFRIDSEFEYEDVNDGVYLKAQREVFPECYGTDCMFYDYVSGCTRSDDDN